MSGACNDGQFLNEFGRPIVPIEYADGVDLDALAHRFLDLGLPCSGCDCQCRQTGSRSLSANCAHASFPIARDVLHRGRKYVRWALRGRDPCAPAPNPVSAAQQASPTNRTGLRKKSSSGLVTFRNSPAASTDFHILFRMLLLPTSRKRRVVIAEVRDLPLDAILEKPEFLFL